MFCTFIGKITNRKLATCSCQCKENIGSKNYNKQSHICAFVKSASSTDDISKIQRILGNLDINSEAGKGNPKNSSQKDARRKQSGSNTTTKQPKITFNYLYSKLGENIDHDVGQMNPRKGNETKLDSSFKLKSDVHTFADKDEDTEQPCKQFLDSEVSVVELSMNDTELANGNLTSGELERKGILEEYDCLDVGDEIMDMSSIIQNIVCVDHNKSDL